MKMISVLVLLLASQLSAQEPLERYTVVSNLDRTSPLIEYGSVNIAVSENLNDNQNFEAKLKYVVGVRGFGKVDGTTKLEVPNDYFTEDFLTELRQTGFYQGENFKIAYRGVTTAYDLNGNAFPQADILHFYDIESQSNDVINPTITARVKLGASRFGAIQLDLKGRWKGLRIKIGADFDPKDQ